MSTVVNNTRNENLQFVDDLSNYKVHHDDTDIRGFKLKTTNGENIGEVEGLLADVPAKLVRYVEVEIDDSIINRYNGNTYTSDDRHALIPIGIINIDSTTRSVFVNGLLLEHLIDYPRYNRNQGYTTRYEIDTNDYLADRHEYGSSYDRDTFSTDEYRNSSRLHNDFYGSHFYTGKAAGSTLNAGTGSGIGTGMSTTTNTTTKPTEFRK